MFDPPEWLIEVLRKHQHGYMAQGAQCCTCSYTDDGRYLGDILYTPEHVGRAIADGFEKELMKMFGFAFELASELVFK